MKNPFKKMFARDGYRTFTASTVAGSRVLNPLGQTDILDPRDIELLYRDHGFVRKVIDVPLEDAMRNWRGWNGDEEQNRAIERIERLFDIEAFITEGTRMARLYGGCAIFISVTGQGDVDQPLDPSLVTEDTFKYLQIVPKSMFNINTVDTRFGSPTHGEPLEYKINITSNISSTGQEAENTEAGTTLTESAVVHRDRLIILKGDTHPVALGQPTIDSFWGYSALQALNTALRDLAHSEATIAALMTQAQTPTLGIPGLAKALFKGETTEAAIATDVARIQDAAQLLSMIPLDSEYELKLNEVDFAHYQDMVQVFRTSLSGQTGIPQTKLFGVSPAGLNPNGGSQRKDYQDLVRGIQTTKIQPAIKILDDIIVAAAGLTGITTETQEELKYEWLPLETPTDEERSDAFLARLEALTRARALNVISEQEAQEEYIKIRPDVTQNS